MDVSCLVGLARVVGWLEETPGGELKEGDTWRLGPKAPVSSMLPGAGDKRSQSEGLPEPRMEAQVGAVMGMVLGGTGGAAVGNAPFSVLIVATTGSCS